MKAVIVLLSFVFTLGQAALSQSESVLSLEDCRQLALESNQDVLSSQLNTKIAGKNISSAKSDFFPALDGAGTYRFLGEPINPGNATNDFRHYYKLNASVSQPLYTGGQLMQTYKLAKIQKDIASAEEKLTGNEIVFLTDLNYWNVVALKEKVGIVRQYRETVGRLVEDVRDRVEGEITSRNDLLMAEVTFNEAQLLELKAKNAFDISIMELNRLLGLDPDATTEIIDSIIVSIAPADTSDMLNRAFEQRPEIAIGEGQIDASETEVKLTASRFNPSMGADFTGYYGAPGKGFTKSPDLNYYMGAKLSIPIFHWNKRRIETSAGRMQTQIAGLQLDKQKDLVRLDVNKARYSLDEAEQEFLLTNASLLYAEENLTLVYDRYLEGLSPIIEVLYAQINRQEAYSNFIHAKANYQVSLSFMIKSLGEY